jgi:DNA-binding helix-hairpin-helix protein with protein kinase domain
VVGVKKGGMAINHPIEALIARFSFHHNAQQSPGRADTPAAWRK